MEIIKKKICLENFISRIPALIETVDVENVNESTSDGSWGKIPKPVSLLGKAMKYGTLMDLYYPLLKIVMNSDVIEYDAGGQKWRKIDYDWRDIINKMHEPGERVSFVSKIPTEQLDDRMKISVVTKEEEYSFNDNIVNTFGGINDGLNVIEEVHHLIGKKVTPSDFTGMYVPYFIYLADVPDIITFMEDLKAKENCCDKKRYEEYGGDGFLDYLKNLVIPDVTPGVSESVMTSSLDIPILLTSDLINLGVFRMYDVEEVTENEINAPLVEDLSEPDETVDSISKTVLTSGESKLKPLRKRKRSVDDYGKELPGIYVSGQTRLELPYQVGYVKNIQIDNGVFYGDVIESMVEVFESREATEREYDAMYKKAIIDKLGQETPGYKESDGTEPIEGLAKNLTMPDIITYGGSGKTYDQVVNFALSDSAQRRDNLVQTMCRLLKDEYPDYYCYKQEYKYEYELTYNAGEDENGNVILSTIPLEYNSPPVHVIFDEPKIEITYALGAKLRQEDNRLILDETSPFKVPEAQLDLWKGEGIWYFETYPLKKLCVENFIINEKESQYTYDMIDFSKEETTYTFEGIDFPRKNYILCNDIRYKSESYQKFSTYNPVFRDEKMMNVSASIKENYDVVIDRGFAAAFERHLQLGELKTWADLENYRNGMFLNK